jgi:hypothetical protein
LLLLLVAAVENRQTYAIGMMRRLCSRKDTSEKMTNIGCQVIDRDHDHRTVNPGMPVGKTGPMLSGDKFTGLTPGILVAQRRVMNGITTNHKTMLIDNLSAYLKALTRRLQNHGGRGC